MTALLICCARCSTDEQDRTVQEEGLESLGVTQDRIYDHGLTGSNRERPGLREALSACRDRDTLVVTKLDRLARSLPDARAIADELTTRRCPAQPRRRRQTVDLATPNRSPSPALLYSPDFSNAIRWETRPLTNDGFNSLKRAMPEAVTRR